MRRCKVCNEQRNEADYDFCEHRWSICMWCCTSGGHNEELADEPDRSEAADPTAADLEASRYEDWIARGFGA